MPDCLAPVQHWYRGRLLLEYVVDRLSPSSFEPDISASPRTGGQIEREGRQVSLYRVGALTVEGRRELCVVRNVSAGGLMLTSFSTIEPGARITVEFKQGECVEGMVAWSNGKSVGMQFDRSVDVAAILANPSSGRRPRMLRIDIECAMTVRAGAATYEVRALDISQGGVCVETRDLLSLGADVIVRIEGLPPEPAVVRWRDGDCYGLGFNRLLSVNSLAAWLQDRQPIDGQAQA